MNFSFGEKALKRDYKEKRAVLRTLEKLETDHGNLPTKIDRLQKKMERMKDKIDELESKKVEQELESFDKYENDDLKLLVRILSTENTDILSHKVKDEIKEDEVMVVLNERETISAVVGVGEEVEKISAKELIQELSGEFGGGGGGTDEFAQGGGFEAGPKEVKDYLVDLFTG